LSFIRAVTGWKSLQRLAIMAATGIGGNALDAAGGLLACTGITAITSADIA